MPKRLLAVRASRDFPRSFRARLPPQPWPQKGWFARTASSVARFRKDSCRSFMELRMERPFQLHRKQVPARGLRAEILPDNSRRQLAEYGSEGFSVAPPAASQSVLPAAPSWVPWSAVKQEVPAHCGCPLWPPPVPLGPPAKIAWKTSSTCDPPFVPSIGLIMLPTGVSRARRPGQAAQVAGIRGDGGNRQHADVRAARPNAWGRARGGAVVTVPVAAPE